MMKIRDSHARINGNDDVFEAISDGIEIIAEDGRSLFSLSLKDNVLHIDAGMICKHKGLMLDDRFVIRPVAANCVKVEKVEYVD